MARPTFVLSIKSIGVNIVPRFNVIDSHAFLTRLLRFLTHPDGTTMQLFKSLTY